VYAAHNYWAQVVSHFKSTRAKLNSMHSWRTYLLPPKLY
jgi:hypothetical protein